MLLVGCGKKKDASSDPSPGPETPADTASTPSPAVASNTPPAVASNTPPAAVPVEATDLFEEGYQRVLVLEADAELTRALRLCRELRSKFRSHERVSELNKLMLRLQSAKRSSMQIRVAIENLAADKLPIVQAARMALLESGDSGRLFLRRALRDDAGKLGIEAAALLARMKDAGAVPGILSRLKGEQPRNFVAAVAGVLHAVVMEMTAEQLAAAQRLIEEDETYARREVAGALQVLVDGVCGGSGAVYDERVGVAGSFDALRDYVERGLTHAEESVMAWACEQGGSSAGYMKGVRGRYYDGWEHDPKLIVTQRLDAAVNFYNQNFRYPSNRYVGISARWDGYIAVAKETNYVFQLQGEDWAKLWVDGKRLARANYWRVVAHTNRLSAGLHEIRVDMANRSSTAGALLRWGFPGAGPSDRLPYRTRPWPDMIQNLKLAMESLNSTNSAHVQRAKVVIGRAGSVGDIFLRDVLSNSASPNMAQALDLLVDRRDSRTPAFILARLTTEKDPGRRGRLLQGVRDLAHTVEADAAMLGAVKADATRSMIPDAIVLCGILEQVCGNDEQAFDVLLGEDGAYSVLGDYVEACLTSRDAATVQRAVVFGTPFAPYLKGLTGEYFKGFSFEAYVKTRRDGHLNFANRAIPFPAGLQNNIAIRWRGVLVIEKPGKHIFNLKSYALGRVRIGQAIDLFNSAYSDRRAETEFEARVYPVNAELRNWSSNNGYTLLWRAPGDAKETIVPPSAYRTALWFDGADEIMDAIEKLTETNPVTAGKARILIEYHVPASYVFLRNTVRYGADDVAGQAARILARHGDGPGIALIAKRLAGKAQGETANVLAEALALVPQYIAKASLERLYRAFAEGPQHGVQPIAIVLSSVFSKVNRGQVKAFGDGSGDAVAGTRLTKYFDRLLISADEQLAAWAMTHGGVFAPQIPGMKLDMYQGTYFDASIGQTRVDKVYVSNRAFPTPGSRQDYISARWTGTLTPPTKGKYVLELFGEDHATLWIEGEEVLDSRRFTVKKVERVLDARPYAVRVDLTQTSGNTRLELFWTGPGITRRYVALPYMRTSPWPRWITALTNQLSALTTGKKADFDKAVVVLKAADTTGRHLVRNALRNGNDRLAIGAGLCLAKLGDQELGPLVVRRLGNGPSTNLVIGLTSALRITTNLPSRAVMKDLYGLVRADSKKNLVDLVRYFEQVLVKECKRDAAAFGKRMGDAKAVAGVTAYVAGALKSADGVRRRKLATVLDAFYPLRGLRGEYYSGGNLDKAYADRLDHSLTFDTKSYAFPKTRPKAYSARWTGLVKVPSAGSYVFYFQGTGKAEMWIDEKPVATSKGTTLTPGAHDFKFQLTQSTNPVMAVSWNGPGVSRQVMTTNHLRAIPWK